MFCLKCGEVIPDGSTICPKCGADPAEKKGENSTADIEQKKNLWTKMPKAAKFGIAGVIAVVVIVLIINGIGKAALRRDIKRAWLDTDGTILKVLDITDDKIEYRLETGYRWLDTTLGRFDYTVIGANKIKVKRTNEKVKTYTIEFNEEKDRMTITPAFTDPDVEYENWYYIEEY